MYRAIYLWYASCLAMITVSHLGHLRDFLLLLQDNRLFSTFQHKEHFFFFFYFKAFKKQS